MSCSCLVYILYIHVTRVLLGVGISRSHSNRPWRPSSKSSLEAKNGEARLKAKAMFTWMCFRNHGKVNLSKTNSRVRMHKA